MACLQEWQKTENKNALSTTERERQSNVKERKMVIQFQHFLPNFQPLSKPTRQYICTFF